MIAIALSAAVHARASSFSDLLTCAAGFHGRNAESAQWMATGEPGTNVQEHALEISNGGARYWRLPTHRESAMASASQFDRELNLTGHSPEFVGEAQSVDFSRALALAGEGALRLARKRMRRARVESFREWISAKSVFTPCRLVPGQYAWEYQCQREARPVASDYRDPDPLEIGVMAALSSREIDGGSVTKESLAAGDRNEARVHELRASIASRAADLRSCWRLLNDPIRIAANLELKRLQDARIELNLLDQGGRAPLMPSPSTDAPFVTASP